MNTLKRRLNYLNHEKNETWKKQKEVMDEHGQVIPGNEREFQTLEKNYRLLLSEAIVVGRELYPEQFVLNALDIFTKS